jgi:hypothetical protein
LHHHSMMFFLFVLLTHLFFDVLLTCPLTHGCKGMYMAIVAFGFSTAPLVVSVLYEHLPCLCYLLVSSCCHCIHICFTIALHWYWAPVGSCSVANITLPEH